MLWLVKGLGPGGMERLLVHHARFADRDRFEYQAAYLVDRPDSVVGELEAVGVKCTRLTDGSSADPRWLLRLRDLVRSERIDVVHAHSPQPAAMARPMLRAMRPAPALVYTEHNTWDCYGAPTRVLNAATYPLDRAQFAVSRDAADSVPNALSRRVEVLTHGIDREQLETAASSGDVRSSLGIGPDTLVVTTVAHLRTEKAHEVLLEAAAEVLSGHDDVVFLCVGHGPRSDELAALARQLGVADKVQFLGFRDDVPAILAASDVFCLSSHQEGLPLAYMEASTLGVPSVVTAVGGLVDHVQDGVNGFLVPPAQPAALATALSRVLDDTELRSTMSAGAAVSAVAFDARTSVATQEAAYADLVAGHPRRKAVR